MKIIISPAKKMREDCDSIAPLGQPEFLERTSILLEYLRGLSYEGLKTLLQCNDSIASLNYERFRNMDLMRGDTPAILAYEGIQYQYMAPEVFSCSQFHYIQKHLRILSGFYGVLKPFDGIVPYRLEMNAKLKMGFYRNLYDFWGDSLAKSLINDDTVLLNLASAEYSKAVVPYLDEHMRIINVVFGELDSGIVREKGVYVKMARGAMVRHLAEQNAENLEAARNFSSLGFSYCAVRSNNRTLVFLK